MLIYVSNKYAQICFDMLYELLQFVYKKLSRNFVFDQNFIRRIRLITRDDPIIDWRLFYRWTQVIFDNQDEEYSLVTLRKFVY